MTKKDYLLISKAFFNAKAEEKSIDQLINDLSADLKADNTAFNPDRFKTACGLIKAD